MYDIMIAGPVDVVIPKLEGNYCPGTSVCKVKMNRQRPWNENYVTLSTFFYLEAYLLERTTGLITVMMCYADPRVREILRILVGTLHPAKDTRRGTHCFSEFHGGSSIGAFFDEMFLINRAFAKWNRIQLLRRSLEKFYFTEKLI